MYDLPFIIDATLASRRMSNELLKYGQGDRKASFSIPIKWIDELDLFSNIRLQDPYGLGNVGEVGRYYYIESLSVDFMNEKIDIVAIDLYYLLKQCMIIPHCGDVAETWMLASDADRMFAYAGSCATESFSDGEPLKTVCSC